MNDQTLRTQPVEVQASQTNRPRYETPSIRLMSEKDILNSFQITQSMGAWWTIPTC